MTPTQPRQKFTDARLFFGIQSVTIHYIRDVPSVHTMTDFGGDRTALVFKEVGAKEMSLELGNSGHTECF